jgi:DNA-binding LacI/PurR family transcriptional regulator
MAGTVTIKDIAEAASVSTVTVSRVFNNHPNVSSAVRERVFQAAADLGYSRRRRGDRAEGKQTESLGNSRLLKEIGFLFAPSLDSDTFDNPFWSRILAGVESEARRLVIKMTCRAIVGVDQTSQALLSTLYDLRLSGILLLGPAELELVRLLQSLKLPLVLIDNHIPGLAVDSVLSDNFEGAKEAVSYLIREGHTQIAFIAGPMRAGPGAINTIYTIEQRAAGYRAALYQAGLPLQPDVIESSNLTIAGGYEACQRLLARRATFSALFCANDLAAIGAIRALREAGRRVPDDTSIIGFDDVAFAEHLTPGLTTVWVHKRAMGTIAVRTLVARAANPEELAMTITLPVELIKRQSVAPFIIDRSSDFA